MIELPDSPAPNGVEVELLDYGLFMRSPTGGSTLRVDRAGSRYKVMVSFPPMKPDVARAFTARLARAKREGLRIDLPLLGASQGNPGSPVVDGADQAGTTLALRGFAPGYLIKEGYAFHLDDGSGGRCLHHSLSTVRVDAAGLASISIEPPLHLQFPDGAAAEFARPTVQGLVTEAVGFSLSTDRLVRFGGAIVIEESDSTTMDWPSFDETGPTFDMGA